MMYDEHYGAGEPGQIASNKWFQHTLKELNIPSDKLIVAFGNYGYDWKVNSKEPAKSLTFSEVMVMAHNSDMNIQWDKMSGNPYFRYKTGDKEHTAWFLDGVTLYNQVKSQWTTTQRVCVMEIRSRRSYNMESFKKIRLSTKNPDVLHKITSLDEVNYSGQGEILQIENEKQNGLRDFKVGKDGYLKDEVYQSLPSAYEVQRYGKPKGKQVVLTFDDGPDPKYTPEILDILKENKIKAAFFVLGENAQLNTSIVKRIYDEGHEIGNHTFKHPNVADTSLLRTKVELNTTQRLIQEITGHSTVLFRPPYRADANPDSSNEILPILRAQNMNYTMVAEKVDPEDWATPSTNELVKRALNPVYKGEGNIILLHDAGGNRTHTGRGVADHY